MQAFLQIVTVIKQQMLASDNTVGQEWKMENEWLNAVSEQYCNEEPSNISWAAFHANKCTHVEVMPSVSSLLPLFHENSTSLSMVRHGMDILRAITMHLNLGQCPVICVDQPLFCHSKINSMELAGGIWGEEVCCHAWVIPYKTSFPPNYWKIYVW